MKETSLFLELLRVALGEKSSLSDVPTDEEWKVLYQLAVKQSVLGLIFTGISKLNIKDNTIKPPSPLFHQWYGSTLAIREQNRKLDDAAQLATRIFASGGFRSCVLKGQGLARLYPESKVRQPGDIDLWVEGSRDQILHFLKNQLFRIGKIVIHHVDCSIINGISTEIHFIPVWEYNPLINYRLQKYFKIHADEQFANTNEKLGFAYPTNRFNAVYCLSHIYMHFLYEGIGLRQLIDYYYVIKHLSGEEKLRAKKDIHHIGLDNIAGAVMYVLHHVCGMAKDGLICEMDVKRGQLLLSEIMRGGNFGHSDTRIHHSKDNGKYHKNMRRFRRELTFLRYYPLDIISIPFWKVWHWCWRKFNGYI